MRAIVCMYCTYIQVRSTDRAVRLLVSTDDVEACETRREEQGEESVRWSCGPLVSEDVYVFTSKVRRIVQFSVHGNGVAIIHRIRIHSSPSTYVYFPFS